MSNKSHFIDLVQDPVCIVRHRGRKHDNFKQLREFLQEFITAWPNHVKSFLIIVLRLLEMNQGFIKVQHQRVQLYVGHTRRQWFKKWDFDSWPQVVEFLFEFLIFCQLLLNYNRLNINVHQVFNQQIITIEPIFFCLVLVISGTLVLQFFIMR